jgi:hypothetical protein
MGRAWVEVRKHRREEWELLRCAGARRIQVEPYAEDRLEEEGIEVAFRDVLERQRGVREG